MSGHRVGPPLSRFSNYHRRLVARSDKLREITLRLPQLRTILTPKYVQYYAIADTAVTAYAEQHRVLDTLRAKCDMALLGVEDSVQSAAPDTTLLEALANAFVEYVGVARQYARRIAIDAPRVEEVDQILAHELDVLAGTEDIALLIELLERRRDIEVKRQVDEVLEGLKDLKKATDQFVADHMLSAISGDLTADVMAWHSQLRTKCDPDVHFSGFDLDRTTRGEVRARRVQIKATSYGKDLVSAVSSLSESKLNALGLCMSIATNMRGTNPFNFLIIDDPIQSWDLEHEVQFIEVIRALVESDKQIILLSHNRKWIEQVRAGCRSCNGWFYEIRSYNQDGPLITRVQWAPWKDRLDEVDALIKDPSAGPVRLQQAEEEIRIIVAEIASELYWRNKGEMKSPHDLNSKKVRKMLIESGVAFALVDKLVQTFKTTDDAHHAPVDYTPSRERLARYHARAHDLVRIIK